MVLNIKPSKILKIIALVIVVSITLSIIVINYVKATSKQQVITSNEINKSEEKQAQEKQKIEKQIAIERLAKQITTDKIITTPLTTSQLAGSEVALVNIYSKLYNYLSNSDNNLSTYNKAIELHSGIQGNNCAYFISEALRRQGVYIPNNSEDTEQVTFYLEQYGFTRSNNVDLLVPGTICFTTSENGTDVFGTNDETQGDRQAAHVYVFMGWSNDAHTTAYVADNNNRNGKLQSRNITYKIDDLNKISYLLLAP